MNKEELEKLNKEIKKAQDKLAFIDIAINRDSLIAEQKEKESKELLGKTEQLESDLRVLQENYAEEKQSLKVFREDSKEKKDKLIKEINKLENEISTLGNDLSSNITSLEASKTGLIEQINTLSISFKKEEDLAKNTLSSLIKQIEIAKKELNELSSEYKTKSANYEAKYSLNDEILKSKAIEIEKLEANIANLDKNIAKKAVENSNIELSISEKQLKISLLNEEIAKLSTIKDSLQGEIDTFEKEKAQYVSDKFALQRNKEDLDKREEFIKNKYQEAGVRYN